MKILQKNTDGSKLFVSQSNIYISAFSKWTIQEHVTNYMSPWSTELYLLMYNLSVLQDATAFKGPKFSKCSQTVSQLVVASVHMRRLGKHHRTITNFDLLAWSSQYHNAFSKKVWMQCFFHVQNYEYCTDNYEKHMKGLGPNVSHFSHESVTF